MASRRPRVCSECPNRLVDENGKPLSPLARTCSLKCRSRRQRRLKRGKAKRGNPGLPPELEPFGSAPKMVDVGREVMKEELRPVARELITTDVLTALEGLVGLTGQAVAVLAEQLSSPQPEVSQKAAALVLRYTAGNASIAPPPQTPDTAPMQVVFNVPGPVADEPVELQKCTECNTNKPPTDFVAGSELCSECYEARTSLVKERFGA